MSQKEQIEKQFEELLTPVCEKHGVEVYDVEYVKEGSDYYLRAYIDKEGGVTIGDCEVVNRELSDLMDEKDFIKDAYILEVSSPGLGRTLKKDRHYEKALGQEVEIKTFKPIDGSKEFAGILKAFDDQAFTVVIDDTEKTFQRADIALMKLAFHL